MGKKEYDKLKAHFLKSFANVPFPLRNEIIAVVGSETFTWSSAKEEIIRDTNNAKKILSLLNEMGVIQ